ncbi:uncharacterized protein CG43867 isoform X3 [Planococcus citri]|uniref:uncharacterized protein CG43867 isoform X3 n=1 Tax=Planococcus citri TaxID=170843 RepID=UPI0031F9A3D8
MDSDDYRRHSHSGGSSPPDPLARLSDYAQESSCSSWSSSDESLSYHAASLQLQPSPSPPPPSTGSSGGCFSYPETNWQQRYTHLQAEMSRYRRQANRTQNMLQQKLTELELRVAEAESRAEDAEDKVRLMEERLQSTDWASGSAASSNETVEQDCDTAITKLASQVEEQRQLRLQDAKIVEAKAARIKEWVANKLRDLEAQNQHLREQNDKCNQQLELLKRHMAQLSAGRLAESVSAATSESVSRPSSLPRVNSTGSSDNVIADREPVYAQVDRLSKKTTNTNEVLTHRRYLSACTSSVVSDSATSTTATPQVENDIHSAATLPATVRPKSVCVDSDMTHDYAEIYTPSREKLAWNSDGKPPTPPLHRFPSWESRIYQVANEGLSNSLPSHSDQSLRIPLLSSSQPYGNSGYCDISCPVYATVKGRASQIRSSPFSGDSSDDSSDGEDHIHSLIASNSRTTNSSTDNTAVRDSISDTSMSSSSPSKSQSHKTASSLSPLKRSSSGSPSKNTSFESGISDDYAIPPDAVSCSGDSTDWSTIAATTSPSHQQKLNMPELCFEKCGHLAKLGGKLKTWRKRWFHLSTAGKLRYWKTQGDINRKPRGEVFIDEMCKITRAEGGSTFEISTPKKTYYLTADSIPAMEDWLRILQNVQRKNATKLLLSKENFKPTLQGWLTKVRNGHAKKCWCILIGKSFLYFKSPSENNPGGQINMREARVEQVEHVSDSDSDEKEAEPAQNFTIGIFPSSQPPTYLLMPSKQEMDSWLYHLTVVSGGIPHVGTQYEQLIQKLMEIDGDASNVLWKHPLLLHTKETLTTSLTTLPSETLVMEALKLFKCCQLFMSVAVESAGIDYHVVLAQNALQQCLDNWQLQAELLCALIKQTSPHSAHKMGVQVLSKLRHRSLFACDTAGSPTVGTVPPMPVSTLSNVDNCKANPPTFVFLQGWQLLALAVSLFVPKDHKILWFLKCHLRRNSDMKTECGKYAAYCERAIERTIQNGNREMKPSRMEVLSILLKNPYHHSLPHSIPVHFLNGTYQVVGFDGSTSVQEFLKTLTQDVGCRDSSNSGFTLFSDDPIEKDLEHYIDPQTKLCDVISKWETVLREKGSGKFENTKVIQLVYKNRLYFRHSMKKETDRERLLMCYQTNHQIVNGRFPLTKELALELAALMAQIDFGEFNSEKGRGSGSGGAGSSSNSKDLMILQAVDKFYPYRYRDGLSPDSLKELQISLQEKWFSLKGRSLLDCVRIYLTCTRKWPYFGASLFQAKWKQGEATSSAAIMVWLAASEDNISLLELSSMQMIVSYSYHQVLTFGGCQDDFMLVISTDDGLRSQKLLFSLSKPKILELTLIIADYMNALGHNGTPIANTLNRNIQPDILKATPDHQLNRSDSKKYHFDS